MTNRFLLLDTGGAGRPRGQRTQPHGHRYGNPLPHAGRARTHASLDGQVGEPRGRRGHSHGHERPAMPGRRGGGGRGGDGGSRRPLGRGDLRLLLLARLAEQPCHGYELIRHIGELFAGAYAPSPGVVYPTLALLEDMGWIAADAEGGRKRYAITGEGQAQMAAAREQIEAAQLRARDSARRMAKAALPEAVREQFHTLKMALINQHGEWSQAHAQRVADILANAAQQVIAACDPAQP